MITYLDTGHLALDEFHYEFLEFYARASIHQVEFQFQVFQQGKTHRLFRFIIARSFLKWSKGWAVNWMYSLF